MGRAVINFVENAELYYVIDWYKDENGYTDIGKVVYDIKYNKAPCSRIQELADVMIDFFENTIDEKVDLIVPVPSYNPRKKSNPNGDFKMMYQVAIALGKKKNITVHLDLVEKLVNKEAKNNALVTGDIVAHTLPPSSSKDVILLIDDLYGNGITASLTATAIKEKNPFTKIIFFSVTRNKFGGMGQEVKAKIDLMQGIRLASNGNKFIGLLFLRNGLHFRANIFSNHDDFLKIKELYDENYKEYFSINVKENNQNKGLWDVSKVNSIFKDELNE